MSGTAVQEAIAQMRDACDALAACDIDLLTCPELVAALDELETVACRLPAQQQRLLARLQVESTPQKMGAKNWCDVLTVRYRISPAEAKRRLAEAALLTPRPQITGPALDPVLPAVAAAQAAGAITTEHITLLRKAMARLPGFVDVATRAQIEVNWVRTALGVGPRSLERAIDRELFLLDQDGPEPDDIERGRKRGLSFGRQGRDGMTPIRGNLTPEAAATLEALLAKLAAPGMCNPDDPEPCTSGTPSQEQIDSDHRSLAQRQHDALVAGGRMALMSGELGKLNGLPVTVIIRTTLDDLESRAGVGVSGGGTVLPIRDVIRLGGHANQFLAVFDRATGSALDLFRTRRVASAAQRIMLIARDGGCTKPGCTVGAYGCQAHHAVLDWAEGGLTNIDDLTLACGPDNRLVNTDEFGWTTTINARGEAEWIPPASLDTGQARINYYHRPELLLRPPDDETVQEKPYDQPGRPAPAVNEVN